MRAHCARPRQSDRWEWFAVGSRIAASSATCRYLLTLTTLTAAVRSNKQVKPAASYIFIQNTSFEILQWWVYVHFFCFSFACLSSKTQWIFLEFFRFCMVFWGRHHHLGVRETCAKVSCGNWDLQHTGVRNSLTGKAKLADGQVVKIRVHFHRRHE